MTRTAEIKAWHVGAALTAAFAVVLAVNIGFVVLAISSHPGEDVPRAYAQGLKYNETLDARAEQARLGWQETATLEKSGIPRIVVTLADSTGAPLSGLTLTGMLRRPLTATEDRTLAFSQSAPGVYSAEVEGLLPGNWDLTTTATTTDGRIFEARKRLWH